MENSSSGEAIWARARSGDSAAFTAVFDEHRDRVFGLALRHARSSHDAEDITALVFLELWRRRDAVRVVDGSVIAWLLVTTNHVSQNFERTKRRYRIAMARIPAPEPQPDHADDFSRHADGEARRAATRDAFARLSQKDQDVLTLCVIAEMTVAQAAEALGVPSGTVKSRLSRAKDKFRALAAGSAELLTTTGGVR